MATIRIKDEPLTYSKESRFSFFGDLATRELRNDFGAAKRLGSHAREMRTVHEKREQRARAALDASDVEYRVEPNRTPGFGGNFGVPLWLEDLYATAVRPGRVLASLITPLRFELPPGVSSINLPIITGTGTTATPVTDTAALPDTDLTDSAGSSTVVTIAGSADIPLQMVEQSGPAAGIDAAILGDLLDDADSNLEQQLLYGTGSANSQLVGINSVATSVTYTDASPTGSEMWPVLGKAAAQLGDARLRPPEAWLCRTSRWSWLQTQEDTAGRPFAVPTPFYLGNDVATPNPSGGLISWPVFLDDAISATINGNEDQIFCLRPSDMVFMESQPVTAVFREALSATLGARVQLHSRVAAITNRYPTSVYTVTGSGMAVASGY